MTVVFSDQRHLEIRHQKCIRTYDAPCMRSHALFPCAVAERCLLHMTPAKSFSWWQKLKSCIYLCIVRRSHLRIRWPSVVRVLYPQLWYKAPYEYMHHQTCSKITDLWFFFAPHVFSHCCGAHKSRYAKKLISTSHLNPPASGLKFSTNCPGGFIFQKLFLVVDI